MEKLKKLQELTGNTELAFSQADLDSDFDPQQHEQLMKVGAWTCMVTPPSLCGTL